MIFVQGHLFGIILFRMILLFWLRLRGIFEKTTSFRGSDTPFSGEWWDTRHIQIRITLRQI